MYVNFPYLCSNMLSSPAYGVYVSQLIQYARACSAYDQFLIRGKLFANKFVVAGISIVIADGSILQILWSI